MNIKRFIFGDKKKPIVMSKKAVSDKNVLQNPYLIGAEGRNEWNDRYMNMAKSIKNWQLAFLAAIVMAVILVFVVAKIATESRVQPFVVETNEGMPYAIRSMPTMSAKDQKIINYAINQFIINAKTIIADTNAEKAMLNKVYAYSADDTLSFLRAFYGENNPFTLASQYTISVSIVNAMPISSNTWQVTWDETKHQATSGSPIETTRWMANLTYKFGDVNPQFVNDNPFGIYITNLTWSQSQTNSH